MPRWRASLALAAAVAAFAACAAGCGSTQPMLSSLDVERGIARSILAQHHAHVAVRCPPKVPRQKGITFVCTAQLQAGRYSVSVIEADGSGHVRWRNSAPLVTLTIARVERAIRQSIRAQRGLRSRVTCPTEVLQKAGVVFECHATIGRRQYPFTVTEVDGRGHVRYVGR